MALPVYNSREVQVAWNGYPITGLVSDSFVTFSRNSDLTEEEVGADGQLSISILPDRTGTCTLDVQQNSLGNLVLAGVMEAQELDGSFITGTLSITDPSGSVLAVLNGCHLKTAPEISLGQSAVGASRSWVFFCENMKFSSSPAGITDAVSQAAGIAGGIATILGSLD